MYKLTVEAVYLDPSTSPIDYQRDVYQYWLDKCLDRFAPSWNDFELLDFPPKVIPNMMVTDVNAETHDATYRFWGTFMTRLHNGDYTGKSVSSVKPQQIGDIAKKAYRKLCEEKKSHLEVKEYFNNHSLRGREIVLRMPLSDDGINVTNTISVAYHEILDSQRPHEEFFDHILVH